MNSLENKKLDWYEVFNYNFPEDKTRHAHFELDTGKHISFTLRIDSETPSSNKWQVGTSYSESNDLGMIAEFACDDVDMAKIWAKNYIKQFLVALNNQITLD